jgi:nucleotide-binding universal stress UspA family protein
VMLALRSSDWQTQVALINLINLPLLFASNALFPTKLMPSWLQSIAMVNPVSYANDAVRQMLLGSVADEIFRQATRPVLTVGPEIPPQPPAGVRLRRLLCAADLSSASAPAMNYSFLLAQEYGAQLSLLYVAQKVDEKPAQARSRLEEFSRAHIEELGQAGPKGRPEAEFLVESGSPVERILKVATEREIDLIVLGLRSSSSTRTQPLTHLPGLTAYQVVSLARCPVLTVRG